jgi:F0F1-type ATP synthase beta subunit
MMLVLNDSVTRLTFWMILGLDEWSKEDKLTVERTHKIQRFVSQTLLYGRRRENFKVSECAPICRHSGRQARCPT